MKEYLIGEIEAVTQKKIGETKLLFTMNKKSDFKVFHWVIKKERLMGEDHLVYIFKNKSKKGLDNIFAITVIKQLGNKNLQNWGFLTSLTNQKTY